LTALRIAENRLPDVVVLDFNLSKAMDGWEVTRRMQQRANGRLPLLIASTGYAEAEMRRRSSEEGIHLHLFKPVGPVFLKQLLNRFKGILGK
jgi:CheY-like chemotaxis protein